MFRNVPGCSGMFRVPGFIDGLISIAKALKNISHIYISYTVPKKYKRRMHEKFPSLHRGSYKG